jgi:hypothetical protein
MLALEVPTYDRNTLRYRFYMAGAERNSTGQQRNGVR